jgi:hypothetical protein
MDELHSRLSLVPVLAAWSAGAYKSNLADAQQVVGLCGVASHS